jgi:putative transposase
MAWVRLLAYITGTVDQELLLRNEYLAAKNRVLKAPIKTRLELSDAKRARPAEIGHRLAPHFRSQIVYDSRNNPLGCMVA